MHNVSQGTNAAVPGADFPVALASVSVAGQCRERSPVDLALFGEAAERFIERFADRMAGEALLARALSEGAAEAEAVLLTAGGMREFRVSLWRQRGGEKVRLVAAFAASGPGRAQAAPLHAEAEAEIHRIAHDLHGPVGAIIAMTEALREGGDRLDHAGVEARAADIAAASWRVARLAEELRSFGSGRAQIGLGRVVELDFGRLVDRARRLALLDATQAEVSLPPAAIRAGGALPGILADESVLRGLVDDLLRMAVLESGRGGVVRIELGASRDGGLVAEIVGERPDGPLLAEQATEGAEDVVRPAGLRGPPPRPARLLQQLAGQAGASLTLASLPGGGVRVVLGFARSRCLPGPDGM